MSVTSESILEICRSVWTSVLDRDVERLDADLASFSAPVIMTSCVQITGAWEGAVTLQCQEAEARAAAAMMLLLEPGSESDDEVRDAFGELVNMIGGNVKALLPGPTQLSLPLVVAGSRDALSIVDAKPVASVFFISEGRPFLVTLLGRVRS